MKVKYFAQEKIQLTQPGLESRPLNQESSALVISPPRPLPLLEVAPESVMLIIIFLSQITFSLGCMLALSACFWFYVQDIKGKNVIYVTAVIMGCGGSVMLVTSLSLIAELIGHDKVNGNAQNTISHQFCPKSHDRFAQRNGFYGISYICKTIRQPRAK